jgi:hypothetical protein
MPAGPNRYDPLRKLTPETRPPDSKQRTETPEPGEQSTAQEHVAAEHQDRQAADDLSHAQPTRPLGRPDQSFGWPESPRMDVQQPAATAYAKRATEQLRNAQLAADLDAPKPRLTPERRHDEPLEAPATTSKENTEPNDHEQRGLREATDAQKATVDRLLSGLSREAEHEVTPEPTHNGRDDVEIGTERNDPEAHAGEQPHQGEPPQPGERKSAERERANEHVQRGLGEMTDAQQAKVDRILDGMWREAEHEVTHRIDDNGHGRDGRDPGE